MQKAYTHASEVLEAGRKEAEGWVEGEFGPGVDVMGEGVGSVRFTFHFAMEKIRHLDTLPRIFCRLDEAGIKSRIERLWNAVDPKEHHRLARKIMEPGSALRREFDAVRPDGTNIGPL